MYHHTNDLPLLQRIGARISPMVVPLIVGCALFMQMLDATVIATALPAMAVSLNEDPVRMNIAITAYLLSVAVFVPICGWAADRFGARQVFAAAIALFTVASMGCGFAQTLPQLLCGRVVQGFAGAMMVPVGRIVLLRSVKKSEMVRAMSFLSMPALLGPIMGPALGGFLVTYTSWRWIFFINVPIGLLGVVLVLRHIKNIDGGQAQPLDVIGFILTGLCLASLVFSFDAMAHGVLSPLATGAMVAGGLLCGWLYILHARRTPHPILDFSLLKVPTFSTAIVGGNLCRLAVGAVPFLLAMQLQVGFGLTPFAAGMLTFSGAVGALAMKVTAPRIIQRAGFRKVLMVNAILTGLSIMGCILFDVDTPHMVILAVLLLGGFFRSLQLTAVNTLAYADITSEQMGRATGLASVAQQLAISLGVALAAFSLKTSMHLRGVTVLEARDVMPGYLLIGIAFFLSIWYFRGLSLTAGAEVSGKK
ncbi:MFS transporter [Pigmentiphaga litoralis]|jgi:EmrB/QacA subfamily drug resistance transporter|uniref:DHA2 family efflux MFS transporter permease subunit n=1 Tax=Pigmentiphaga litoralis TaxID=516702 RepID=UPI001677A8A9|nr:DHA2 family efflux MFS transporter permease subunit [Pigmentiphaga litoralis]GGX14854.1 MFS transporter [Pigmentiphaga litoralis]